jgi:hypothetical protein
MVNNQLTHYVSVTSSARLNDLSGRQSRGFVIILLSK